MYVTMTLRDIISCLQCFDAVAWPSGRVSNL